MMKKNILVALKGFGMGAANVIPGVSGGTIALLTGIYNEIIDSINAFTRKDTWKSLFHGEWKAFWKAINGTFLLSLGVGIILSILTLAKVMTWAMSNFPVETWGFFFGLIIASAVIMFRGIKGWGLKEVLLALAGAAAGVVVCSLDRILHLESTPDGLWFIFICGAIAICTMILPGISGSFILLVLGKYTYIMEALDVTAFNWPVVAVFGLGCVVGILAFAAFLHWLLARREKETMIVLLGFILGSLIKVWPWADKAAIAESQGGEIASLHIPGGIIFIVLGAAMVLGLEYFSSKKAKK